MHLDLPTLMAMGSFISAATGVVLLVAWWQNQREPILGLWGFSNLVFAAGIISLMLGSIFQQSIETFFGGILLAFAPSLIWKATRTLDAKPTPLVLIFLGTAVVGISRNIPGLRNYDASLSLAISAAYLFAAAITLWLGRKEQLNARWPIIGFTGIHAVILTIGAYATFSGTLGKNQIPPVTSLFGVIHFEHNIFILGTAVFILALIKERNEAASVLAAHIDSLTGIVNRGAFMERAERILERCRREHAPISLIMFDLDEFKTINDGRGHAVGDAVIKKFCEVVIAGVRPDDVFGRIGGEEFAVVLPGSCLEAAHVRADRIRASFAENCHFVGNHHVDATVSAGVATSTNGELSLSALLESADMALYRAKNEGRNRVKRADKPVLEDASTTVLRIA